MDWYVIIVMVILIGTMIMGITYQPAPRLDLFYGGLAGAIIMIAYGTIKNRKEQQALRKEKRKSKKK